MSRFWSTALLSAALMVPIAVAPSVLRAQDQKAGRSYHDKKNNDDDSVSYLCKTEPSQSQRIFQAQRRRSTELLELAPRDRKSTRLNSSHLGISYAVFC